MIILTPGACGHAHVGLRPGILSALGPAQYRARARPASSESSSDSEVPATCGSRRLPPAGTCQAAEAGPVTGHVSDSSHSCRGHAAAGAAWARWLGPGPGTVPRPLCVQPRSVPGPGPRFGCREGRRAAWHWFRTWFRSSLTSKIASYGPN